MLAVDDPKCLSESHSTGIAGGVRLAVNQHLERDRPRDSLTLLLVFKDERLSSGRPGANPEYPEVSCNARSAQDLAVPCH